MAKWLNPLLAYVGIPYEHWFVLWLLQFSSSSLPVAWKAIEDGRKPLDPAVVWKTWKKLLVPAFGWAQFLPLRLLEV